MFARFKSFYWKKIAESQKYARHIGVTIGLDCLIGTKSWGTEPYLITIGNKVVIAEGVKFLTHGGGSVARSIYPDFDIFGKIVVEDGAYIGASAIILPGVTIGYQALVAAGSVVTKSVPPRTVVAGNPARIISSIDQFVEKNLKYNTGTKGMSETRKKEILLNLPDNKFIKK